MSVLDILGKRILFMDGGTGTLLQERGLTTGALPEIWTLSHKEVIIDIHKAYFDLGCDVVLANTFGANRYKLAGTGYSVEEIVTQAVENAKTALCKSRKKGYVALDVGSTGKLLKPLGDLDFEDACSAFAQMMKAGERAGCDLIVIETMSDVYELKAAVLAAKENTSLPVFATVTLDEKGKLLTGADIPCVVALLEGLGVDALGINCGLGPKQMRGFVKQMLSLCSIPVIVNPNAGLPRQLNGETVYDITPDEFAQIMLEFAQMGAWVLGGCCGTTPEHMEKMQALCKNLSPVPIEEKMDTLVCSYAEAVRIGGKPIIIGERINPTGKARFKQALREADMGYILEEGLTQQEKGAHILDVNVGLPDVDEPLMMVKTVEELQGVLSLPLQIDTSDTTAMGAALRRYNGKAMINSVNGKKESMEAVLPLVKKYGGVVVGLTLDEDGIPESAQKRFLIAQKIVETAQQYGIHKKNIVIDTLCMAVSSDDTSAIATLEAIRLVKERLGVKTVLGVSNISFGLPQRDNINAAFYTMALQNGLDSAIINPNAQAMMQAYHAYCTLAGWDKNCMEYIAVYGGQPKEAMSLAAPNKEMPLHTAIEKGLKELSAKLAQQMMAQKQPLAVINEELVPALNKVGQGFESGTLFLPQLLMSAEAAKAAFAVLKEHMDKSGQVRQKRGKVILATVKGDIHDIGKNIVKVLLDNYNFEVIDLGRDVLPETIVAQALDKEVMLVGLSALMTTTVASMEQTIQKLRIAKPDCKVMVGGAVLNQEYADGIGAHYYAKDAMASVYYAQKVLE